MAIRDITMKVRELNSNTRFELKLRGNSGRLVLRAAGTEVVLETSRFGVVGIAAALRQFPALLAARQRLLNELRRRSPDLVVAIDAGALHLGFGPIEGICPWVRQHLPRTKIFY